LRSGAAAAAADATASLAALIDRLGRSPAAGLKAGGIGSRELVKIGKALGLDETRVRIDLELLNHLGFLTTADGRVGITRAAAGWRAAEPAHRYPELVAVWWTLPIHPSIGRDAEDKVIPAADRGYRPGSARLLRIAVLTVIDELGPDRFVEDPATLPGLLRWHRPLQYADEASIAAVWLEAHSVGVLVGGRVRQWAGV